MNQKMHVVQNDCFKPASCPVFHIFPSSLLIVPTASAIVGVASFYLIGVKDIKLFFLGFMSPVPYLTGNSEGSSPPEGG